MKKTLQQLLILSFFIIGLLASMPVFSGNARSVEIRNCSDYNVNVFYFNKKSRVYNMVALPKGRHIKKFKCRKLGIRGNKCHIGFYIPNITLARYNAKYRSIQNSYSHKSKNRTFRIYPQGYNQTNINTKQKRCPSVNDCTSIIHCSGTLRRCRRTIKNKICIKSTACLKNRNKCEKWSTCRNKAKQCSSLKDCKEFVKDYCEENFTKACESEACEAVQQKLDAF